MKNKIVLLVAVFISITAFSQKKWTLKECVDHALVNNITIKQNRLNLQLAEKDVEIAKGNFLPNLSASTNGGFGIGPVINPQTNSRSGSTTSFSGSLGFSSGVTVFNGFRNLNTLKQAKLGIEGGELDLQKIKDDISLNVVNFYLNVLFAKENLNVAKVQSEISKKQIESAKARFDAGVIPKSDVLNVEATAANDTQNVVAQENTLNLALLNLSQILQVSSKNFDVAPINVGAPSAALLYDDADVVYEKALLNRPEIEKAKLNIENADLNIEIAKGAYMPTVSASAGANTSYFYDLETSLVQQGIIKQLDNQLRYNLGFNVSIPIFNRFQTKNNIAKSKINRENIEFQLESEKLRLQQTIEQAYLDAKAAAKTYEVAQISLTAQKEAFKNAQESYNFGAMTQFDFDQVRNRFVNAEGAIIRAKYDYVFKTKVLKFYYGESVFD